MNKQEGSKWFYLAAVCHILLICIITIGVNFNSKSIAVKQEGKNQEIERKFFNYLANTFITSGDNTPNNEAKRFNFMDVLFAENFLKSLTLADSLDISKKVIPTSGDVMEILNISGNNGEENIVIEEEEEPTVEINGVPTNYVRYIDCQATAYCLCRNCTGKSPSSPGYGVTASGYKITPGIGEKVIAVDRKVIKLGTKVYVEGLNGAQDYGYAVARDTGGAIKGNIIDLYMDSHEETGKWGRRKVRVYILPD